MGPVSATKQQENGCLTSAPSRGLCPVAASMDRRSSDHGRGLSGASQGSTLLLSYRPSFITNSCDLAGAVPMDVEEGVGGCVQRGCGGSGEQAVHGELRGARQLQWLQLRRVMLRVLMYELVQESLVLLWCELLRT